MFFHYISERTRPFVSFLLVLGLTLALLWLLSDTISVTHALPSVPGLHAPAAPLAPNTILTVTNPNDDGPGSLRRAIADALDGDIINFDNNYSIYLSSTLEISKQLTIDGGNYAVTVSGDTNNDGSHDVQVIYIDPTGVVKLSNLNIVSGTAIAGGGIYNHGTLTVTTCAFNDNVATVYGGGGIFNDSGNATVQHSTLSNNLATSGGGGAIFTNQGALLIQNSTLFDNSAINGGAVQNSSSALTATNISLFYNSAASYGGAIYNSQGTLLLQGSTIYSNTAPDGGGLSSYNSTTNVQNSSFISNSASGGGGIYYDVGTLIVQGSTVRGNSANRGGGIYVGLYGVVTVTESTFSDNSTLGYGGGVFSYGRLAIQNSSFSDNSAAADGGAICNVGPMTMLNSTVFDNSASNNGGGIFTNSEDMTVRNSTFMGNSAANSGGGIYSHDQLPIWNSTFLSNTAKNFGGGIFGDWHTMMWNNTLSGNSATSGGGIRASGVLELHNTIIANSPAGGDCINVGSIVYNDRNLIEDSTCDPAFNGDPVLGSLHDNGGSTWTMALLPGSPAIDAGDDGTCIPTDQRGVSRPQGSRCDIGAYESQQGWSSTLGGGDGQSTTIDMAFANPLTLTVSSANGEPVDGGHVQFVGPLGGAGLNPITSTAIISNRVASITVTANHIAGSYVVTANARGASSAILYHLTNTSPLPTLIISYAGNGSGNVLLDPPGPSYLTGTLVTLMAVPSTTSRFIGWSGDVITTTSPFIVTMNNDMFITATFTTHRVYLPLVRK
jgi:predicted outer membrane repeat protein